MVNLSVVPHLYSLGKISGTASASSPNGAYRKEQGKFSCSLVLRSVLTTLTTPGRAILFCLGEVEGPLS